MSYFTREFVCRKLSLSNWQSYGFFPANKLHVVKESDVLGLVNNSRVNLPPFKFVPDLVTARELQNLTNIPHGRFRIWTLRTKNPVPHVRFNSHAVRYPADEVRTWIERMIG